MNRRALGDRGERIAAEHLIAGGFTILEHQYRKPYGEIDLIAARNGCVHFVEVKTRRGRGFAGGLFDDGFRKRRAIERVAKTYIGKTDARGYQFDVMIVDPATRGVEWIEDAWEAGT